MSRPWLLLLAAIVLVTGCAATETYPVAGWLERTAVPLRTSDPAAPLDDLDALAPAVGDAEIVGLGESNDGGAELLALKHRVLRDLLAGAARLPHDRLGGGLDHRAAGGRLHPWWPRRPGRAGGAAEPAVAVR